MRELKFRARYTESGEWCIGSLNPIDTEINLATFFMNLYARVLDFNTLGQYTGLEDKNGRESYFDDLVKWGKTIYKVVWNEKEGRAALQYVSGPEVFSYLRIKQIRQCEVIGNIHENPELLEVQR